MFLRSQTGLLRAEIKTMHPYEWGILGVKAIALLLAIGRMIPSPSSTSAGCFACCAGWRACSRRVGRPPPMPNCTNSNASWDALLDRKGDCPVQQLARSWLQYRLTLASSTVLSKSKQPRAKLSSLGFPECA